MTLSVADQLARLVALEVLRQQRRLTPAELAERDGLEARRDNRRQLERLRLPRQLEAARAKAARLADRCAALGLAA